MDDAYFAGYFDGEGTFGFAKRSRSVQLQIRCTDRDILDRFAARYGGTVTVVTPRPDNPKQQYRWQIGKMAQVAQVIHRWLPYLGERRASRAREALLRIEEGNPPFSAAALTALSA